MMQMMNSITSLGTLWVDVQFLAAEGTACLEGVSSRFLHNPSIRLREGRRQDPSDSFP